ncbi:hypothetical protein SFRURICE_012155, partial [Spodoptera frugiperda]
MAAGRHGGDTVARLTTARPAVFDCFDKFEEEFQNGRGKAREKATKDKNPMTTLQSIHEDEDETTKSLDTDNSKRRSSNKSTTDLTTGRSSTESNSDRPRRPSKKRSKHEVDDMSSPEQDKRQKRNASVKAQSIISKQVNVNLSQKLRREDTEKASRGRRQPRKAVPKEKPEESSEEEGAGKRRTTRTRKQTDNVAPPVPSARSTRASSRSARHTDAEEPAPPPAETRPKRTRAKKKVSDVAPEPEKATDSQESVPASPAEKPRPKRTRRAAKAAEKPEEKQQNITPPPAPAPETNITPKEERISHPQPTSPILQKEAPKNKSKKDPVVELTRLNLDEVDALDKTRVIEKVGDMDKTVVIPNGVYSHAPVTPKNVLSTSLVEWSQVRQPDKGQLNLIKKKTKVNIFIVPIADPKQVNITDDNSLLTDDSDATEMHTPPKQPPPHVQPTSAVKEKVQQFEELASRVTRTKTRAMAKKDEQPEETHTPPDKIVKPVLSAETLNKMNNMIFNGKPPQISSSATKPRANIVTSVKSLIPASTSKLSGINRAREAEELKREREDARKKKEAMLEAKRELQKRKREEKMAAAAAAREAADRERRAALELAQRERMEKQAHADQGKLDRLKEAERKKQELARKVAETEERRRAEEQARQQRLAEEQRRADEARRKQLEEAAAMKKEAAIMAKEIEKRQKEYIEKQKMKHRMEDK